VLADERDTYKAPGALAHDRASAWDCGDPGLQFDSHDQRLHTCPNTARINASNPCSEYMFLDNSACNLASLNLRNTCGPMAPSQTEAFKHAIEITILAQEIIVGNARYPTPEIGPTRCASGRSAWATRTSARSSCRSAALRFGDRTCLVRRIHGLMTALAYRTKPRPSHAT